MSKKIIECKYCKKKIEVYNFSNRKFCSKKCYSEYTKLQTKYLKFTCQQCGKEYELPERFVKAELRKNPNKEFKFCSTKCSNDHHGRNRVEVECPVCHKKFLQQKKLAHMQKTCSPECAKKNPNNRNRQRKKTVKIECEYCKKIFEKDESYVRKQNNRGQPVKFCSHKCASLGKRQLEYIKYKCDNCQKELIRPKNKNKNHFCDEKCKLEFFEQQLKTLKCKHCGKEFKTTTYKFEHNRKYCSRECMVKDTEVIKNTYKTLSHYLRTCKEYSKWRLEVFKLAHYECTECGSKKDLHAHHIKELYSICKENNFILEKILYSEIFNDVNNGLCLCAKCHREKHPYSDKFINDKGQFCRSEFTRL